MIGKTISHYKILEKLGEGGMGVVYKAEDTKLDRAVALKFLAPHVVGGEEEQRRLIREAKSAAALNHPNICTVHEIDRVEGRTFIAMECIEGQSLKTKIESGPLELNEAVDIAIQIAEGLQEAHEKDVIHRDIKPANVMLTPKGQAKIMDFGLAKVPGRTKLTKTGMTLGTAAYMSPEQARGSEVDHRTDIWSLGIVLYEMVTGEPPFKADYEQAALYLILNEMPTAVASRRTGVPEEIERIIKRALEKRPSERYGRAEDFKKDLESFRRSWKPGVVGREVASEEPKPSIAVLPFRDMSSERDQDYFCEGIAEELINALVKLEGLSVAARTSAFQFKDRDSDIKQIGAQLEVRTVLEGSVRKSGNRLRITAQLVNVEDGFHLWSEKYDCELKDIFAIQDEISLAIVDKLKIRLLGRERQVLLKRYTVDQEAHNLYLKGLHFWNRRLEGDMKMAMEHFRLAIEKDPGYALPYVGIADTYSMTGLYCYLPPNETFPKAREAARKALEIDPTLGEAHASLGWAKTVYDWDWRAAEREFLRAVELNPSYAAAHYWYGLYLVSMGRFDEGILEAKRSRDIDPLSPVTSASYGVTYYFARRYDECIANLHRTLESAPNFFLASTYLVYAFVANGTCENAVTAARKFEALAADSAYTLGILGYAYGMCGQEEDALRILGTLNELAKERYVSPIHQFVVLLGLDRVDEAFEFFEKAYMERNPWLVVTKAAPFCDPIRSDTRYKELLRKIGFEE